MASGSTSAAVAAFAPALEANDLAAVRALLEAHPTAIAARPWGDAGSLLHAAAEAGCAEVVALLLDAGAGADALDEDGQCALHVAAGGGHLAAVRVLTRMPDCAELVAARVRQIGARPRRHLPLMLCW